MYTALYNYCYLPPPMPLPPTRGITPVPQHRHFRNDYGCYTVDYQEDGGPILSDPYLIDTYRCQITDPLHPNFCPNYYDGPEPLNSFLDGINYALSLVEQRRVTGDMLGLLGFDQSAKIIQRKLAPSSPGTTEYEKLKRITDIAGQTDATLEERFQQHFLFPRVDAVSNYPEAFKEALELLRAVPGSEWAENFVVLMSDGLTFCTSSGECSNTDIGFQNSFAETQNLVLNEYVPNKVKFHFLMTSDITAPHTLVMPSVNHPGSCMDEQEAALSNPPISLVDYASNSVLLTEAFVDTSKYFFSPNQFYQLVRTTNGLWGPVRECYDPGTGCKSIDTDLINACAKNSLTTLFDIDVTDSAGRLKKDRYGRNKRQQIRDHLSDIFSRNPFVLVQ